MQAPIHAGAAFPLPHLFQCRSCSDLTVPTSAQHLQVRDEDIDAGTIAATLEEQGLAAAATEILQACIYLVKEAGTCGGIGVLLFSPSSAAPPPELAARFPLLPFLLLTSRNLFAPAQVDQNLTT